MSYWRPVAAARRAMLSSFGVLRTPGSIEPRSALEDSIRTATAQTAAHWYETFPEACWTSCKHSFQGIDQALIVRVDEAAYRRSWQVAREWDCRHEFSLLSRDCVEFLRAVGLSLGLDMPRRGMTRWTPHAYVRALLSDHSLTAVALANR